MVAFGRTRSHVVLQSGPWVRWETRRPGSTIGIAADRTERSSTSTVSLSPSESTMKSKAKHEPSFTKKSGTVPEFPLSAWRQQGAIVISPALNRLC
jgi:hypothetical protein